MVDENESNSVTKPSDIYEERQGTEKVALSQARSVKRRKHPNRPTV